MKRIGLIVWLVFKTLSLSAQGEANHILANDFGFFKLINGDLTAYVYNGPHAPVGMNAIVMSDCEGELKYYYSGNNIRNKNHIVMVNGGLVQVINPLNFVHGHGHETIKKPGSDSLYYYLSTRKEVPSGSTSLTTRNFEVNYALINTSANSGLGRVESKGNVIRTNVSDGFTVVRHANKKWYWLLIYDWNLAQIHAHLINETEIHYSHSMSVQITDTIGVHASFLISSPKGDQLYLLTNRQGQMPFHLFKFNKSTGQISNHLSLAVTGFSPTAEKVYSEAFSPQGTKLYLKVHNPFSPPGSLPLSGIIQADLTYWNVDSIISRSHLFSGQNNAFLSIYGSAADGKIYIKATQGITIGGRPYHVARIENPELLYPNCVVTDTAFFLAGHGNEHIYKFSTYPGHFYLPDRYGISAENFCFGDTTILDLNDYDNLRSISWHFGDSLATINTSNDTTPRHVFSQPGTYTVTAYAEYCNHMDTLTKTITIVGEPNFIGISDTAFCLGGALSLQLNDTLGQSYRWSDNDTSRNKNITTGGWHWLETSNACFTRRDSFYVDVHEPPAHGLPSDTSFCAGDVITLSPAPGNYRWVWNDGDTLPKNISTPGSYLLIMDNRCGSFPFAIQVAEREPPVPATPSDTLICEGRVLRIELPDLLRTTYQWQDGSSERIRLLTDTGWYEVTATNECGSNSRGFQLNTDDCSCNICIPNAFSPNGDGLNDRFELQSRCRISQYDLVIYNRWGQQLYRSSDITQSWDGYYQGELLPVGEYVYHLYYYREGLGPRQTKGSFRLLR